MPSTTEVVNAALKLLGGAVIGSLDDGSTNAGYASAFYDILLDDMLREHEWDFATKRRKLSQLAAAPVYEFDHAYAIPDDWIRTIQISDNDAGVGSVIYKQETLNGQRVILASREDLWMRYVYRAIDPGLWSVDFTQAMVFALARDLAIPVASSTSQLQLRGSQAARALAKARSTDAAGSSPPIRNPGSWVRSRGGRSTNVWPIGS